MKALSSGATLHRRPLIRSAHAAFLLLLALSLALFTIVAPAAHAADSLLSQGKSTTASSLENATFPASNATDGNAGTRWSSAFSDPQWLEVDLGATATVDKARPIERTSRGCLGRGRAARGSHRGNRAVLRRGCGRPG